MGEQMLFFEDVHEGDEGPPLSRVLTRTDFVVYAGASGDFNPMHVDEVWAKEAGLPCVFGHGMLTAGLLATAITRYIGIGNLSSYKVRFAKQIWPGETLTTRVTVTETRPETHEVVLACEVVNQDGQTKVTGEAVAILPLSPPPRSSDAG